MQSYQPDVLSVSVQVSVQSIDLFLRTSGGSNEKGLIGAPPGAAPILIMEENNQPSSKRQFSSESLLQGLTC